MKNLFAGWLIFEWVATIGSNIPFLVIVVILFAHVSGMLSYHLREEEKAREKRDAPPTLLTEAERDRECRIVLMNQGITPKSVENMDVQQQARSCHLDKVMKYKLITEADRDCLNSVEEQSLKKRKELCKLN